MRSLIAVFAAIILQAACATERTEEVPTSRVNSIRAGSFGNPGRVNTVRQGFLPDRRDEDRGTGGRLSGPEGVAADLLLTPGLPAPLPAVTPPAVGPQLPAPKTLEFRRRQGFRQTRLTGPGGVSSGPVQKQSLLGS